MEKAKLITHYSILSQYYEGYLLADKKTKESKRDMIRNYVNGNDELYLFLSEDSASGLFRSAFFESDISRSVKKLEEEINKIG